MVLPARSRQYFIAVPDMKSVGVKDGKRYEGWPAIIRAVNTTDAMTATIEEIPYPILHHIPPPASRMRLTASTA